MLFDAPLIPGLRYAEEAISAAEEEQLIERLLSADLTPFKFQGWTGNRKTRSFGWRYDFDDASFARTEPIPPWLEPLQERAAAFAQLDASDFVHVLVARYHPGAGIGWHRDRDVFDRVVGFSFAAPATLRFRRRKPGGFDRARLAVAPRSAYLLSAEARTAWEHSIAPGGELRFSVTFRTLSDKGRKIAAGQA
jgi:alkylated DNA repair protein (DNA oxidative demethylase)